MKRLTLFLATTALLAGCSAGGDDDPVITAPTATPTITATTLPPVTVVTTTPAPVPTPTPTTNELSPKPSLESPPPVGQPACRASDLTVTDADTQVEPSYRKEVFVVRTKGPDCQFNGYPTVQIQGVTTQRGGFGLEPEQPKPVTLSRDTSVSFLISSPRSGSCRDIPTITVTLPQTSGSHRVSSFLRVCGNKVGLSPVHRQEDIH